MSTPCNITNNSNDAGMSKQAQNTDRVIIDYRDCDNHRSHPPVHLHLHFSIPTRSSNHLQQSYTCPA